jgi:hypothetical protein
MKVISVKKGEDCVRFSVEVEIDCEGLRVNSFLYGGVTDRIINGIRVQMVEDPDSDHTYHLFGKQCKYNKFKELYSELFSDKFDDFEDKIDDLSINSLQEVYPHQPRYMSDPDRTSIINHFIKKCPVISDINSDKDYYTQVWDIVNTLHGTEDAVKSESFETIRNGKKITTYGIPTKKLTDILQKNV